ncbi:hypothetical protein C8R26_11741 [Nitrosomonas oligotropha]|uniref:Uncharacterized protein n=1 Tax=Nitrosomonas oligotropha TaxID=42354 RepID=A0A2T5HY93_9PROT|nr:hypothetical protein [Nitrosomonas oligotropha]PTQ76448.1 hypothetical protein C8R26_11741 [Nitrosomonas oligotropha]
MAYLYQGKCLDTVQRLHESVAAACPPVSGNYSLQCTPSAAQVDIVATDIFSAATYASVLVPSQIPCDVSLLDQTAFFWQLAGVLVAGFAVRAIIKAFQ